MPMSMDERVLRLETAVRYIADRARDAADQRLATDLDRIMAEQPIHVWVGRCKQCGAIKSAYSEAGHHREDLDAGIVRMVRWGYRVERQLGPVCVERCAHETPYPQ